MTSIKAEAEPSVDEPSFVASGLTETKHSSYQPKFSLTNCGRTDGIWIIRRAEGNPGQFIATFLTIFEELELALGCFVVCPPAGGAKQHLTSTSHSVYANALKGWDSRIRILLVSILF